jgi:hypothetical protein
METTEIDASLLCADCVFHENTGVSPTCRFYPKYKNIAFPLSRSPIMKPGYCRIKKIVVYEELPEETRGVPDVRD